MQTPKERLLLSILSLCFGLFGLLLSIVPHIAFAIISFLFIVAAVTLAIFAVVINRKAVKNLALIAISVSSVALLSFVLVRTSAAMASPYPEDVYDIDYDRSYGYTDYDEGYSDGYDWGYEDGYEEGYFDGSYDAADDPKKSPASSGSSSTYKPST